jgi:hypothetical protein
MHPLTKDGFTARASAMPVLPVEVPEISGLVHVRTLFAAERVTKIDELRKLPDEKFAEQFAALVLCDPDGTRWYEDDQLDGLAGANPVILERVVYAGQRHNRLTKADLEELAKLFEAARTCAST